MQKNIIKKGLALAIIVLFIGVSCQPVFAKDFISLEMSSPTPFSYTNISKNNDLVRFSVQICKTGGVENNTVWLTQEKVEELHILIDDFKVNLDSTESLEDTIDLYCEMLESLYNLGIIQDGQNLNDTTHFISTSGKTLTKLLNLFSNKPIGGYQEIQSIGEYNSDSIVANNMLCFISGDSFYSYSIPFISKICNDIMRLIYDFWFLLSPFIPSNLGLLWVILIFALVAPFWVISDNMIYKSAYRHGQIASEISCGIEPIENEFHPSIGWVKTLGLFGNQSYNGDMYGRLGWEVFFDFRVQIGVNGFNGIWIFNDETEEAFYMGFARRVKIASEPPGNQIIDLTVK